MKKRKAEKTRKQKKHAAGWDGVLSWEGKSVCVSMSVCVCMCVCVRTRAWVCMPVCAHAHTGVLGVGVGEERLTEHHI